MGLPSVKSLLQMSSNIGFTRGPYQKSTPIPHIARILVPGENFIMQKSHYWDYTAWWAEHYSKIKVAQYPFKIHSYSAQVVSG